MTAKPSRRLLPKIECNIMYEEQFQECFYNSQIDGAKERYFVHDGATEQVCVVILHGHGSLGDQLLTRQDIAEGWTKYLLEHDYSIIAPDLRGNAWMNELAVADLTQLLELEQERLKWRKLVIVSGSMGGTGGLIFAMRHPELVDGVAALGAATELHEYIEFLSHERSPILKEIHEALLKAYPNVELRNNNSVLFHSENLTMPVMLVHGSADVIIPIDGSRRLAAMLSGRDNFQYRELPEGDHDAPLVYFQEALEWLMEKF